VQSKRFLSPGEVAEELSVSPSTVLRLIHDQRLPAIHVSDRIYRIPAVSFEKYKNGTLETPRPARIATKTKKRPVFGEGEPLPQERETLQRARTA
jgi:excisionase family DNA binding protein